MRFTLVPPGGITPPAQELADEGYGDELVVGPLVVRLEQALNQGFVDDFLAPTPRADRESRWGKAGQLRIYFENERQCLNVQAQLNERVPIGDTGVAVQIVRYLPHARPDAHGRFHRGGDDPKNPVVEIDVYLPGQEKPRRQLAFAKQPLLTLDGVAGSVCPVKFRFDHPAVAPPAGVELLRVDRDTLWARVIHDGDHRVERIKSPSAKIKLAAGFELHVLDYLPYARREVRFESADVSTASIQDDAAAMLGGDVAASLTTPEYAAAAEVEIEFAGARQRLWVSRNVPLEAAPVVSSAEGPLRVHFATATRPLGFQLGRSTSNHDEEAVSGAQPSTPPGEGLYVVADGEQREPLDLATGQTVRMGDLAFHQRSVQDAGHGKQRVMLEVIRDPGRPWKYFGVLLACLGAVASAWRNRKGRSIEAHVATPVEDSITTGDKSQSRTSDDDGHRRTERRAA